MASELEKMLSGEIYIAADPQLVSMRAKARSLLTQYNALPFEATEKRRELIKQLFGQVGQNAEI